MQIIAEMNASIQSERANLTQLEKKSRELQMKLDALTQIEADTTRALNLLEQNDEIVKKRDSLIIQLQDDKETINKKNVYIKDLELKEQQCRRQLTVSQEKYSKLLQQQDQRRSQIETQLTTLRQDYNTLSEERSRLVNKMDQTDKMIKDMESKVFSTMQLLVYLIFLVIRIKTIS
jgi:kinetochore protein Nuf2